MRYDKAGVTQSGRPYYRATGLDGVTYYLFWEPEIIDPDDGEKGDPPLSGWMISSQAPSLVASKQLLGWDGVSPFQAYPHRAAQFGVQAFRKIPGHRCTRDGEKDMAVENLLFECEYTGASGELTSSINPWSYFCDDATVGTDITGPTDGSRRFYGFKTWYPTIEVPGSSSTAGGGGGGSGDAGGASIVLKLTASGSVSDYQDTSNLKQSIATAAGVSASDVTIKVEAASVIITATIKVPASTTSAAVQASLNSKLGTAADASAALGITVESEDRKSVV